jgi:hypothetical protein
MDKYCFLYKGDELVSHLADQVRSFQSYVIATGKARSWKKNRDFYENKIYGEGEADDVIDTGEIGELKAVTFNHFRNILRHILNALVSNVPAFDVTAANTSIKARRSAKVGKNVVEYYHKIKRVNKPLEDGAEKGIVYGDGYVVAEFDPNIGKPVAVDDKGKPVKEGDFEVEDFSPFDVFFDPTKKNKRSWDYVTFRKKKNKYNLAAAHKNKKDEILAVSSAESDEYADFQGLNINDVYDAESPDIWVYATYHKSCDVLPDGKYVLWAGDKQNPILLYEGKNPYRDRLPVFPLSPANYLETSFGFTEANTLRAPQILINLCISYIVTNMNAFGTNNIWSPDPNTTIEEVKDGLNLIKSSTKPEAVSFYRENADMFNAMSMAISAIETLSGQNAVIRGNVKDAPNLKSGVALATVINQAQQYSHSLEMAYHETFEDLYDFIIKFLAATSKTERLYEMMGKTNRSAVGTFTGSDLQDISRIIIAKTNPIAKTAAGKVEIAMELLKTGAITPEQFFDVINTGNLEVATEADDRLLDYIWSVKERLLDGEVVPPVPGINHQLFLSEIQSLLLDIDLTTNKQNAKIVKNISDLMKGHLELVRNGDELAALIHGGQPPVSPKVSSEEINQGMPPAMAGDPNNPQTAQGAPPMPMPPA